MNRKKGHPRGKHLRHRDLQERHLHRFYDIYGRPRSLNLATTANTSQYTAGYGYDTAGRLQNLWHHPTLTNGVPQGNPTFTYGYTYTQATPGDLRVGATSGGSLKQDYMPYTLTRNTAGANPALTANRSYQATRDALHSIENKAGTPLVSSYTYGMNSIGQRSTVTTSGSAFAGVQADWSWFYDSLGQIEVADSPTAARDRAYQYDTIGNRKKFAHGTLTLPTNDNYTTTALNQYSVVPNYTPQPVHDFDGNLTRGPVPGLNGNLAGVTSPADATEIKWDAEQSDWLGRILDGGEAEARRVRYALSRMTNQNRMISCKIGTITYYYGYDHLSRQIGRGETTALNRRYYYDGWNRIAEYTTLWTPHNTFTWGLDLSGTMQGAGGVGGLLVMRWVSDAGTPDYFPTYNGNGNVSEYLATNGAVTTHYEYDPFGGLTRLTGSNSTRFQYRFSTKPRDFSTGLYYYGYRWYDPATGRWPSRDPIEEEGGVNLYAILSNNTNNQWDFMGLRPPFPPPPNREERDRNKDKIEIPLPSGEFRDLGGLGTFPSKPEDPSNPPLPGPQIIRELDPLPYPEQAGGGVDCYECICPGTSTYKHMTSDSDNYLNRFNSSRASEAHKKKMRSALAQSEVLHPKTKKEGYGVSNSEAAARIHAANNLRSQLKRDADIRTRFFWKWISVDFDFDDCDCINTETGKSTGGSDLD